MPLGVGLAIGVVGGAIGGKLLGGGSNNQPAAQPNTSSLVDSATKNAPPGAIQSASNATDQANIAAMKQRKKAAAGDTLLTPSAPAGGYNSGTAGSPAPASLIG